MGVDILDIGCGSGANAIYYATLYFNVTASDCSVEAIRKTKDTSNQVGVDINTKISDFTKLSFDNDSFDAILSDGVFYYGNESTFSEAINESY